MAFKIIPRLASLCGVAAGLMLSGCHRNNTAFLELKDWVLACPNPFVSRPDDPILARIGSVTIRASDYKNYLEQMDVKSTASGFTPQMRRFYLEAFAHQIVMKNLAEASGVSQSLTYRRRIAQYEYGTLISAYRAQIPVSEEEMRSYYHAHREELVSDEITVSLASAKSLTEGLQLAALMKKKRAVSGLKVLNLSKFRLAAPHSDLEKAGFALMPGQVSTPIKMGNGFFVIRRETSPVLTFETAKDRIRDRILDEKINGLFNKAWAVSELNVDAQKLNAVVLPDLSSTHP